MITYEQTYKLLQLYIYIYMKPNRTTTLSQSLEPHTRMKASALHTWCDRKKN